VTGPLRVAVLGTGVMGGAMARRGAAAGLAVTGWSVPLSHAERLRGDGVAVAATVASACTDTDLVVTMAPDADAIESFATGPNGFLAALRPGAVWVQSSTVGVAGADRLIGLASEQGVTIVDAPVLGSRGPVERGELIILASGDGPAIDRCQPWFNAISRRLLRIGAAGNGSRLKIVINHWIMCAVASLAETMALAEGLGIAGENFIGAIAGTEVDMGYAQIKGQMMLDRSYPVQGNLTNGLKDARLANHAAEELGLPALVSRASAELFTRAVDLRDGLAEDMAAAFEVARRPV
jgi:3-hydroxyisobutyrate dehydrogenase